MKRSTNTCLQKPLPLPVGTQLALRILKSPSRTHCSLSTLVLISLPRAASRRRMRAIPADMQRLRLLQADTLKSTNDWDLP